MIMKVGMKSGSAYYQKFPKNLQPLCKISGPGLKKSCWPPSALSLGTEQACMTER